jgi:hypothetical protein
MTYAPQDLMDVRARVARLTGLSGNALGIVGDPDHEGGYHCGSDRTVDGDYSVVESSRDSRGLTQAASALDIGDFPGLQALSVALAHACASGDTRGRDVREIIYSPDGENVVRWDDLGVRNSGDDSHLWHTHISFYRDAQGRRNNGDNFGGLIEAIMTGSTTYAGSEIMKWRDAGAVASLIATGEAQSVGHTMAPSIQDTEPPNVQSATDDMAKQFGTYNLKAVEGRLAAKLDALAAKQATAVLSPDQLASLTTAVTNAVVAHPDTPLGDADKPAIRTAVKEALTALVTGK